MNKFSCRLGVAVFRFIKSVSVVFEIIKAVRWSNP